MRTWLLDHEIAPRALVDARAGFAHDVLDERTVPPVFTHGDYQAAHVYVVNAEVVSVIDWGDTGVGDPLYDLATLTVGHGNTSTRSSTDMAATWTATSYAATGTPAASGPSAG